MTMAATSAGSSLNSLDANVLSSFKTTLALRMRFTQHQNEYTGRVRFRRSERESIKESKQTHLTIPAAASAIASSSFWASGCFAASEGLGLSS